MLRVKWTSVCSMAGMPGRGDVMVVKKDRRFFGLIYVEFVRTLLNLADHLTKGLARDLVHKEVVGMGLKST